MNITDAHAVKPAPLPQESLDGSLIRGIAWSGGTKWLAQVVSWASTLIVVRYLSPEDYGLATLATLYMGLVTLLTEFGVGASIVALRDLTKIQIEQLNSISLLLGIVGFMATVLCARPLGYFFSAANLPSAMTILSVVFIISSFKAVPTAILQRELQFKSLALIEGVTAFIVAVLVVILAIAGLGYWALIWGHMINAGVSSGLLLTLRCHSFAKPNMLSLRKVLEYSRHILVSRCCWYFYSNADFLVAGRVLGQSALGNYSIGWTIANLPIEKISALIGGVTPAFFSAVQTDLGALRRYLLKITRGIAFVTLPVSIGIALVSNDFVTVILGSKWQGAAGCLQLLSLYASLRSITPLLAQILNVTGQTRFMMWNTVYSAILLPIAFWFGSYWGITGIAAGWMLAYPFVAIPLYMKVFKTIDLTFAEYFRALKPAIVSSIAMAGVVFLERLFRPVSWPTAIHLTVDVLCGILVYCSTLWFLEGKEMLKVLAQIRTK
jgi:O-antigen/teichoic acid export membrane protein